MAKERDPWIEASEVIPMFPTLVWKIQLGDRVRNGLDATIASAVQSLRRDPAPLARGAGWQSVTTLHEREEFEDLCACVNRATKGILDFLQVGCDAFEITGCWITVLAKGAAHRIHSHPNNFLSGVYYVRTPAGADTINFHDPRKQTAVIRPPVTKLTAENTDQVVVRVTAGSLLMFPSFVEHSVDANPSEEERVSVSFNVMLSSFTEKLAKPLW